MDKFASKYGEDTFVRNADYPSSRNTIKLKDLFKGEGRAKGGVKFTGQVSGGSYHSHSHGDDDNYKGDFDWDKY